MQLREATQHAAIMAWRDDQSIAVVRLVQEAAAAGLSSLEERLGTVALVDMFGTAEARARAIVRPVVRDHLRPRLHVALRNGSLELRRIDNRLEPLALSYVNVESLPLMPSEDAEPDQRWFTRKVMPGAIASRMSDLSERLEASVSPVVINGMRQWTDRAAQQIGEGTGARARLRDAGANEVRRAWAGPATTTTRPFLSLLLEKVDLAAASAKELVS